MIRIFFITIFFLLISCDNEAIENKCFTGISINESLNLNLPLFVDLQVEGSHLITTLPKSGRKIIIIKRSSSNIKVFDLQCPDNECSSLMTFDGLKLKCPCNGKEYNSLNGSPINGEGCFALEYTVTQTTSNILQITR